MLTGQTPFPGDDPFVVMNAKLHTDAPPLRKIAPDVSRELEEVVLQAMERDPRHRYQGAHELAWDLEHLEPMKVGGNGGIRAPLTGQARQGASVCPFLLMGLIPIVILVLLLYTASHR